MTLRNLLSVSENRNERLSNCLDNNDSKSNRQKHKGKLFSSLALVINASENYACDDKWFSANSLHRAYICLKNVFSKSESNRGTEGDEIKLTIQSSSKSSTIVDAVRSWYLLNVTRYFRTYRGINENASCSIIKGIKESRIFFTPQNASSNLYTYMDDHREKDFDNVTCVLLKLKIYLDKQHDRSSSQRTEMTNKSTNFAQQTINATRCDRCIQCSKGTEFLKVSPDLTFYSRSSLVMNVDPKDKSHERANSQQRNNNVTKITSPSLEYVANYVPKYQKQTDYDKTNLRSFSSSAIFGLQNNDACLPIRKFDNASRGKRINRNLRTARNNRAKMRNRTRWEGLKSSLARTDDEIIRFSNFIEDDLTNLRHVRASKNSGYEEVGEGDVIAVKKIILEDYITEIKEIILSESRKVDGARESRILENVKRRMDDDVARKNRSSGNLPSACSDSWQSLEEGKRNSSYVTKRNARKMTIGPSCCCRRRFHRNDEFACEDYCSRNFGSKLVPLRLCKSCNIERKISTLERRIEALKDECSSCAKNKACCSASVKDRRSKSSRSIDSGVLLDFPNKTGDWQSSDDSSDRNENLRNEKTSISFTDDVLCQRVESVVRKFTEKLILCERKARDRSRTGKERWDKRPITTKQSHHSVHSLFNCLRNSRLTGEKEHITDISTPSLVSLSDVDLSSPT